MNTKILKMLDKNARVEVADIATVLGIGEEEVRREIFEMEEAGIIRGYKSIIDWDKVGAEKISAVIELKVTPTAGLGFEEVAELIASYPTVESVSLMSGSCDLLITVRGKTFREISEFVAKELALIDAVNSTATQFIMRKYKENGVELKEHTDDGRSKVSL